MSPVKAKTPGAALMGLSGVYLIENLVNGTPYVGSAQKFNTRWAAHLRLLRRGAHHSWKLQRDFDLFGEAAFNFRPLLVCAVKDLALFEQRALVAYDAVASGYNVSSDVEAPMRGRKPSQETKEKMRAAKLGVPKTDEHRANMSLGHQGRVVSEDTKAKIKRGWETRRLTPVSDETRMRLSEAGKGKPVAEKSRQALIAWNKAQGGTKRGPMNLSDEERQRRIDANKARAGKTYEGEQAEELKAKKQAAWAERKAKGLHTRRWYAARGLEVPSELSTSNPTCEAVASTSTSTPQKETF